MKKKDAKLPATDPKNIPVLKQFILRRLEDETGTSGTGVVASGVMFHSGNCVMEWLTVVRSIGVYSSIADIEAIHGHGGKTKVEWV